MRSWPFRSTTNAIIMLAAVALLAGGCQPNGPTTRPTTAYERSQKAIDDPMHYRPNFDRSDRDEINDLLNP